MVSARETGQTQKFQAIGAHPNPSFAPGDGWCAGGASGGGEYALCAGLVIASDDAPSRQLRARVWRLPHRHVALRRRLQRRSGTRDR